MSVIRRYMKEKLQSVIDESERLELVLLRGGADQKSLDRAKSPILSDIDYLVRYLSQMKEHVTDMKAHEECKAPEEVRRA